VGDLHALFRKKFQRSRQESLGRLVGFVGHKTRGPDDGCPANLDLRKDPANQSPPAPGLQQTRGRSCTRSIGPQQETNPLLSVFVDQVAKNKREDFGLPATGNRSDKGGIAHGAIITLSIRPENSWIEALANS
jgi:hypothetical protein